MRQYKDSGIEWIGKIPETWEVMQIRRVMRNRSERNQPDAMVLSLYRDLGIVPKESRDDNHNVTSEDTANYKVVSKGNFVINKMKAWQGSMAVSEYDGIVSPAYYVCSFTREVCKKYVHYLLRDASYKPEYLRLSTGMRIGQWDLNIEDFLRIKTILPPVEEQQCIADYLDLKCGEIDSLIALQEQMIEKLKAYKQSIITETVTKGLDTNAKLVPSGIDWIGEVPEGWEEAPLKTILFRRSEKNNPVKTKERLSLSIDKGVTLYAEKTTNLDRFKEDFTQYQLAYPNDIVLNSMNMIVGAVGLSHFYGCVSPVYYVVYSKSKDTDIRYYSYLLNTQIIRDVYHSLGQGIYAIERGDGRVNTCRLKVSYDDFGVIRIPIPPVSEQHAIVSYLDVKCSEIDKLIAVKKQKVEKLKEYKKSVIYEAVTGKTSFAVS